MRATTSVLLFAATTMLPALRTLAAQTSTAPSPERRGAEVRIERLPDGLSVAFAGERRNRAVIGVTYAAASANGDTAGVRIVEVQAGGPADKAGIKSGDVITAVNGVSLHLSTADAKDPAMAGTVERRLQRVMAKAKPGDDVLLRVASAGASRDIKLTTVAASELSALQTGAMTDGRAPRSGPPAIGMTIGTSGSARDTSGLFISSVTAKGPAESAGVIEGERIAAINGVDVRVPREDVDDPIATNARVQRFVREVQKGEPGSTVTLRVVSNGRSREVTVKTISGTSTDNLRSTFRIPDGLLEMARTLPLRTMQLRAMQLRANDDSTRLRVPSLRLLPKRTVTIL